MPRILCLIAFLALSSLPVRADDPPAEAPPCVGDLAFLTGRWEGELTFARDGQVGPDRPQRFEAVYSSADGGLLLSANKAYDAAGAVEFFELELFAEEQDQVVLRPHPGGRPAAPFRLTALDRKARRACFESPRNDWPRRIVYERVSEDRLRIVASGPQPGGELELRLELRRTPSEADGPSPSGPSPSGPAPSGPSPSGPSPSDPAPSGLDEAR